MQRLPAVDVRVGDHTRVPLGDFVEVVVVFFKVFVASPAPNDFGVVDVVGFSGAGVGAAVGSVESSSLVADFFAGSGDLRSGGSSGFGKANPAFFRFGRRRLVDFRDIVARLACI